MAEDQLFYVGQKAFIEKDGKLLVLIASDHGVDLPGGKIQEGEINLSEALQREVREETGLEITVGKPLAVWQVTADKIRKLLIKKSIFLIGYECKYVSGEINLSDEHKDYKWVTKDNFKSAYTKTDDPVYRETFERFFEKYNNS